MSAAFAVARSGRTRTPVHRPPSPKQGGIDAAIRRSGLPSAWLGRLYFAQVREDPLLEIEALDPGPRDTVVVVSSGGCTALSLLGAGAGRVIAVDVNAAQNHLVELKAHAVARLGTDAALAFLGGADESRRARQDAYALLREYLTPAARGYWDGRPRSIARGVLGAGVSERFIAGVVRAIRWGVHPPGRIERLLACSSLEEQRELYRRQWNNRRWRALFRVLLNRAVLRGVYDPAFFRHVENSSFSEHFRRRAEHALTEVPVFDNYFLHQMLTGTYPAGVERGVPPYLSASGAAVIRESLDRLTLADSTVTDYLRHVPDGSVTRFALSNIGEWLTPAELDDLLMEVYRSAAPDARLCFRNFVGWTEIPIWWRHRIVEDRDRGETLIRRDRSIVQCRFAPCRILKEGT